MVETRPALRLQAGAPRATIWTVEDLVRVVLTTGFGLAAVAVSWFIAAGMGSFSSQFVAADVAVGGAMVVGVGNTMWILRGRRAVGARLRAALAELENDLGPEALATGRGAAGRASGLAVTATVVGPVAGPVVDPVADPVAGPVAGGAQAPAGTSTAPPDLVLVGADGMRYFHLDGCRMVRGRQWPPTSLAQHLSSGRAPCPICKP